MTTQAQLEARKEWVAALRSGDYEQGRRYLNKDGQLCCLGVACEIAPGVEKTESEFSPHHYRYDGDGSLLPHSVSRRLGLPECPYLEDPDFGVISLTQLNDDMSTTFEQIADLIEAQGDDWDGSPTEDE